jgi:hypothetical protein
MPFPGPAKEQRAAHHIIQVGNDEKKSQRKGKRIREQTNETFFLLEQQLYGTKIARETYESGSKKKPESAREKKTPACAPAGDDMDRQRREGAKGESLFFLLPQMQARVPFLFQIFLHAQTFLLFSFSLAWSKGWRRRVCVCVSCMRVNGRRGKKRLWMASWGSFVYDFVRCSF